MRKKRSFLSTQLCFPCCLLCFSHFLWIGWIHPNLKEESSGHFYMCISDPRNHRITDSSRLEKHFETSSSSTYDQTSSCQLDHGTEYHIQLGAFPFCSLQFLGSVSQKFRELLRNVKYIVCCRINAVCQTTDFMESWKFGLHGMVWLLERGSRSFCLSSTLPGMCLVPPKAAAALGGV